MRRALKTCAWAAAGLALLIVLLIGALLVAGNTGPGRAMIEDLTRRLTAGHVSLSGLGGSFPSHLTLERLQLRDSRGVWLSAERVTLDWSPLALLADRLQIEALHAVGVEMERLPESSPDTHGGPVSIPRIDVAGMAVDVLKLGPQLAGSPASLTLRGRAHLRSVQDMVISAAAHRIGGDGDYELQLRFDPKRMDAALNLHEPAGGPLENLLELPGLGPLAAKVNLSGPREALRLELSVDAGGLHGGAQGSLDVTALSADLEFALDSPALAPRADLAWQRANLHGRWHGSIKAPQAEAHLEAAQLRLPGGTALATVSGDFSARSGTAAGHAVVGGLRIPGPAPGLLEDSALTLDASMRLDEAARPLDLTASHRLFSLHATAETAAEAAGERHATLELRLPDLGSLGALGGPSVGGSALVKAQLRSDSAATHLTLDANATLRAGKEIWSGLVGTSANMQLSGTLTGRAVTLESLKFTGQSVSLTASGEVSLPEPGSANPQALRARWELNVPDLKPLSPSLAGTARASGSLNGPMTAFSGEAQLTSTLSVHDSPSGTLSATAKLSGLPSAPSGTFAAQGLLDGAPLDVDVAVERGPEGSVRGVIHRAEWKSARADGDVTVARASALTHGQLHLQWGTLADLKDLLGTPLAGSLGGTLELHPIQGRTHGQLHLDARDLKAGPFMGSAQLGVEGVADALGFKLDVQAPALYGAAASVTASGSLDFDARAIAVASMAAKYRGQDLKLLSPARIDLANGVAVDTLKLGAQHAVLEVEGELSPALDLRASLHQLDSSLVDVFVPGLLTSGAVEARAQLQGSWASPTGDVGLAATGLALSDDAAFGLPSLDLHATVHLMGDDAKVDAQLTAGTASRLSVSGQAPLSAGGTVQLKIGGSLDVGMINPLLEARGQHAGGELTIDATVAGSAAEPKIDGTLNLAKGSVRDYVHGVSLTDISAAVVGSEGTLQIKSLTATAAPGTISVTGKIGVLQKGVPVDLTVKAQNAQPLVSKLVTANLNAELHVSGTARERLNIAGKVDLNRTLIGIPNSMPPDVAVLDIRRRGKAAPAVPDKQVLIALEVAVHAPQHILVQGRGLDAEMGGDLQIGGTWDAPFVSGGFDLQRGSFSLSSNKLNFTAGRVSFNGAGLKNKIDPTLDFTAQTAITGATATLRITGLADAPQFEFTSSPALPQDEIMALLLFGVPASQLTGLQLAQVGVALATLSGVGGDSSLNPLVKLQKSLGLDRLTVGSGTTNTPTGPESAGAAIEAGRYITKRVYVEAKQSTTGTSQLEADVELTKHLKLQTRLGNGTGSVVGITPENDPGSSVGLTYQFEY